MSSGSPYLKFLAALAGGLLLGCAPSLVAVNAAHPASAAAPSARPVALPVPAESAAPAAPAGEHHHHDHGG
ncbi:MAG: hypothetical protein R3B48_18290 [Kofleriaceae bacterium]